MSYYHCLVFAIIIACIFAVGCSDTSNFESSQPVEVETESETSAKTARDPAPSYEGDERYSEDLTASFDRNDGLFRTSGFRASIPDEWVVEQSQHVKDQIAKGAFVVGDSGGVNGVWGVLDASNSFVTWPNPPRASPYTGSGNITNEEDFSFGSKRVSF